MNVAEYIEQVESEAALFADAAEQGPLDVEIAGCDGWDMRALVRHLGLIHLWAAGNVAFTDDDWLDANDIPDMARYWPELGATWPDDANLVAWYRRTNENLVQILRSAPDDHQCFSFLPAPTPLTMWARRQASEIAIHRFDAEAARGITTKFDADFAADMLDELLSGFAPRNGDSDRPIERDVVLHVHADDLDRHWYLSFGEHGIATSSTGDVADLTARGSARDLYLLMWNRTADTTVDLSGDAALMELWRSDCRVRWSGGE